MSGGPIKLTTTQKRRLAAPPQEMNAAARKERIRKEQTARLGRRAALIAKPIPLKANAGAGAGAGAGSELVDIGLTDLAYTIFGEKYIAELRAAEIIYGPRDIWEISTPTTQCENVIGKSEGATCWICSLPIEPATEGLTPECEHVLPIAQAVIYLGLYSTTAVKDLFPSNMTMLKGNMSKEYLSKEYKWAHRICNQVKNDDSYLDYAPMGKYFVRKDKITDLLTRIQKNSRSYGDAIKRELTPARIQPAIANAIKVYQEICDFLNSYDAPALLEFAGLISAGYGPRKVGVNRDLTPISEEERASNIRREIIKANIEYSGVVQKTWDKIGGLPRLKEIGPRADGVFNKIVENRRPEYVSLFMRIKPTQKNMNYLIAYIRQQLFSEFSSVNAETELGIPPSRRIPASKIFKDIIDPIRASMGVDPSDDFKEELIKANKLYQSDTSIGDMIRTVLSKYMDEELTPDEKAGYQRDLSAELIETGGESDPVDPGSDYAQILIDMGSINTSPVSDIGTVASDPSGPWIDNLDRLIDLLNSTEKWTAEETHALGILSRLRRATVGGGKRRTRKRTHKRTRKIRRRRT
jgi:hypothetical protein